MTIKTLWVRGTVDQIVNFGSDEEAELEPVTLEEWTLLDWDMATNIAWDDNLRRFEMTNGDFETRVADLGQIT